MSLVATAPRSAAPAASGQRPHVWIAAATVFVVTWLVRLLAVTSFPDDHFVYLAPAQQMLAGEWPSLDFVDPGTPLMYAVSAAARVVVESPLLAEAIVVATAYALAAALTLFAAFEAWGSVTGALAVSIAEVALFPRSYHYPKFLVYAAAILVIQRYVAAPTRRRTLLLSACVVAGFLFRHDHGALLGAAAIVAALVTPGSWPVRAQRSFELAGTIALLALPYLVFLAFTTGLGAHIAGGLEYGRVEASRTAIGPPQFDAATLVSAENARVALFYLYYLVPLTALAFAFVLGPSWALPVSLLALAMNATMLRDPLQARLPDPAVPACILSAWLIPRVWRVRGSVTLAARAAVVAAVMTALAAVNVLGAPREQLDRTGFLLPMERWASVGRERIQELQAPFAPRQFPSQAIEDMVPFLEYVQRCTTTSQRLFVAGEAPEIYVYTRRLFAGGQPFIRNGFFGTDEDQRRLVARMRAQRVPIAIVLSEADTETYPIVMAAIDEDFGPAAEYVLEGHGRAQVRISRRLASAGRDSATGLPCFR